MNPLRNDNQADTAAVVRHVLFFLADAFHAMASCGDVLSSESAALGAAHILETCAVALGQDDEVEGQGGES